jgi:phage FluMu gp28-like protein
MDELVAQQSRIDTSKCPNDFRMAVLRYVTAEDTACIHANMDRTGKAGEVLGAAVAFFATSGLSAPRSIESMTDYQEKISDEQKQDLANIQSTMLNLVQIAMNYGVK